MGSYWFFHPPPIWCHHQRQESSRKKKTARVDWVVFCRGVRYVAQNVTMTTIHWSPSLTPCYRRQYKVHGDIFLHFLQFVLVVVRRRCQLFGFVDNCPPLRWATNYERRRSLVMILCWGQRHGGNRVSRSWLLDDLLVWWIAATDSASYSDCLCQFLVDISYVIFCFFFYRHRRWGNSKVQDLREIRPFMDTDWWEEISSSYSKLVIVTV